MAVSAEEPRGGSWGKPIHHFRFKVRADSFRKLTRQVALDQKLLPAHVAFLFPQRRASRADTTREYLS